MQITVDYPPLYDPITQAPDIYMSDVYRGWLSTFIQELNDYFKQLDQVGLFPPQMTTEQRDALQNIQNGQMIYNTTVGSNQYLKAGVWTSF